MTTRADKLAAVMTAGLINILFVAWLVHAPHITAPIVGTGHERLRLTWIIRSMKDQKSPSSAAVPTKRLSTAMSVPPVDSNAEDPTQFPFGNKQSATEAAVTVIDDDSWNEPVTRNAAASHASDFQTSSARPESDDFAGKNILPEFNMQDSSVMGKLSRMGRVSECGELRAALRKGSSNSASLNVIVRSMQARGCRI